MNTPPQKLELYQTINIDPNNQNLQRNDFNVLANAHNYLLAYTLDLEKRHEEAFRYICSYTAVDEKKIHSILNKKEN